MENPKELLKTKIMHFFNGCKNQKCLSPDCKNFFINREDLKIYRENKKSKGLPFIFSKIKKNEIQMFCLKKNENIIIDDKMEKFKDILLFDFQNFFFLDDNYRNDIINKIKIISNEIENLEYDIKEFVIKEIDKIFTKKLKELEIVVFYKPKNFYFLINLIKFIFAFEFIFEIGNYENFKSFHNFFSNLSFLNLFNNDMSIKIEQKIVIEKENLENYTEKLQNNLAIIIMEKQDEEEETYILEKNEIIKLKSILSLFSFLHNLNKLLPIENKISSSNFKNDEIITEKILRFEIMEKIAKNFKIQKKYISTTLLNLIKDSILPELKFLKYPFLFTVAKKADFLRFESKIQQELEIHSYFRKIADNPLLLLEDEDLFLELNLRRNHILEDAVAQLHSKSKSSDLKKILKVKFVGEVGVDEGGLTKEFFQILIEKLFDPLFGMFSIKNERFLWFNKDSFSCNLNFELVGVLLGLAFYNSTILDLKFPLVVYKKLKLFKDPFIEDQISYKDLEEFEPELYTSFKNLLKTDFTGKETGLTFAINYESWGEVLEKELKFNGSEIDVTEKNKYEFINLYTNFLITESIEKQFKPFLLGFYKVLDGDIIEIFSAEELLLSICGLENLDFSELKKTAKYDSGYTKNSKTIKLFWEVLETDLDTNEKKMFLRFLTGSDRAPLRGLGDLKITISRHGEKIQLPSSHTCFNHLLLPDYGDLENLKKKLKIAIKNCEGFGLL